MDRIKIEAILRDQKEEFSLLLEKTWYHRIEEKLVNIDSSMAQCVIGVRRSGKSTLCLNVIKNSGKKFAYVNFEDEQLVKLSDTDLNTVLECLYQIYGDFNHLFIDEIQNIDGWQYFVNRLLRVGMHILITGSNAKLLSSELSTHLTGRHMQIELYPFSFSEYCNARSIPTIHSTTKEKGLLKGIFDEYLKEGGFPELLRENRKEQYIDALVSGILKNDIEKRFNIAYKAALKKMANHLMNIAPIKLNFADLKDLFGFKSSHTAENYVEYIEKAYLMYCIPKYSNKSRIRISGNKIYPIDVSLMNRRKNAFAQDNLGWRLECIVLIELLRRYRPSGYNIAYLEERSCECDFIICKDNTAEMAIQVCYDITKKSTLNREIKGLLAAAEKLRCKNLLLITDHEHMEINKEGTKIVVVPTYEWLVDL